MSSSRPEHRFLRNPKALRGKVKTAGGGFGTFGCSCGWATAGHITAAARGHRQHLADVARQAELDARVDERILEEMLL